MAEAGAGEENVDQNMPPPTATTAEDGWENEGGALDREPKQAPEKGADDSQHD